MGCRHASTQQAILKEGDASLTNVLQCAKMAELLSKELCKLHEQTTDRTTGHTQQEVHAVRHTQQSRQKQRFRDKQRTAHAGRDQANNQHNRRSQKVCYRCGSLTYHHRDCPFINAVWYWCDSKVHIQACACRLGSQSEKEKWLNTWWNKEQRISHLTCSQLPHTSITHRFYYKSQTSTYYLNWILGLLRRSFTQISENALDRHTWRRQRSNFSVMASNRFQSKENATSLCPTMWKSLLKRQVLLFSYWTGSRDSKLMLMPCSTTTRQQHCRPPLTELSSKSVIVTYWS